MPLENIQYLSISTLVIIQHPSILLLDNMHEVYVSVPVLYSARV